MQEIGVQLASVASWLRFGQPVRVSVWCFRVRGAPSAGPVRRGLCCDQQGLTHAAAQSQELLRSWLVHDHRFPIRLCEKRNAIGGPDVSEPTPSIGSKIFTCDP